MRVRKTDDDPAGNVQRVRKQNKPTRPVRPARPSARHAAGRVFEVLDIGEAEERAYRWLLRNPGASADEVAGATGESPRRTQRVLDTLQVKGLATHSPERPRRYIPASPNIAMEALVLERQGKLQQVRLAIHELQEQASSGRRNGGREPTVELVSSREAGRQIIEQIDRVAQHEIITLIRQPILISSLSGTDVQDTQREAQKRGVRFRSIADANYLALPGAIQRTRADMLAGEDVRIYPLLPFKMILADRRIAFIPLDLEQPGGPSLLVRSSALLDALYALFEILWERAAPIAFAPGGGWDASGGDADASAESDLVAMLATGLNDKAIAHEMDISERTLGRRIVELMRKLGARSRFQIGWLAALRHVGATVRAGDDRSA
jgi:sugar-specific transcriptional regulator TrmB/DNA-binding CsgD family transcriptional regulator